MTTANPSSDRNFADRQKLKDNLSLVLSVVIVAAVLFRDSFVVLFNGSKTIWDDAFMFQRYAFNIIATGTASWNLHGPPTYGATSQLYLLVSVLAQYSSPHNLVIACMTGSLVCGILFLIAAGVLFLEVSGQSRTVSWYMLAVLVLFSMPGLDRLVDHFISGMDTMFDLLYLTCFLLAAHRMRVSGKLASTIACAAIGGLAFLARPDLTLLILPALVTLAAIAGSAEARKRRALTAIVALALNAMSMLGCYLYYKTAVPLSFYAKVCHLYGPYIYAKYAVCNRQELVMYLQGYWPALLLSVVGIVGRLRKGLSDDVKLDIVLLLSAVAFCAYYCVDVLQIMYYEERFYYPTLPILIYLSARAVPTSISMLGALTRSGKPLRNPVVVALPALSLLLLVPAISADWSSLNLRHRRYHLPVNTPYLLYKTKWNNILLALDTVSRLTRAKVATTEVGLPSIYNPRQTIVDMAGLNNYDFATKPFDPQYLYKGGAPDVIYMPHPDYAEMVATLFADPAFRHRYIYFATGPTIAQNLPVDIAVRIDSPYRDTLAAAIKRCLADRAH